MASYATPTDLLNRSDHNLVADLCSDTENGVPQEDLAADANLLAALADASGDVESAMMVGERYSIEDLEGLTDNSLAKLKRIVCTIAMAYLFERRTGIHTQLAATYLERANAALELLRSGKNIFNVADNVGKQTPTVGGLTTVGYETRNLLVDRASGRYFPSRKSRLPTDRG